MLNVTTCPVCKGNKFQNHLSCKDYTVSHETFQLIKCEQCELIITSPRPTDSLLGEYYKSEDYISHTSNAKSIIDRIYLIARKFTLDKKLNLITRYNKTGRLLDYGCGTGEFINHCKSNSWNVSGIEPSPDARAKANRLTQTEIMSSTDNLVEMKFDVITLWHVLEHIPTLDETIKLIKDHLQNTGTIFIAVPNPKSMDSEIYKSLWAGYDVPRHLWHFSPATMKELISRHSLTLKEIVPMKLDSFYVSMLSEKYKRNSQSISGMINAFLNGLKSNIKASKTGNYSSLIYIIKK